MLTAFRTLSFFMALVGQEKGTIFVLDSMMPVFGLRLTENICPSFMPNFWIMAFSVKMTFVAFFCGVAVESALAVVMALQAISSMISIRFIFYKFV